MTSHVTVVGLGRIGLPFSTFLASRGVRVKGVEQDYDRRQMIRAGRVVSKEPGLIDLFERYRAQIELTDLSSAVRSTDISFVVVPTLSRPDGSLSDDILRLVVGQIARESGYRRQPHLIALVSTVSPGTIRGSLSLLLASSPGTRPSLCYNPVFVALGSVLDGLEKPPFILIGADEAETDERLSTFYTEIGYDPSLIVHTDTINAEIAKLSLNAYLTTKIAFANSIAAVCDAVAGADVDSVLGVISRDPRVGGAYLKGGAPFGGPCLPRDTRAFVNMAETHAVSPVLGKAVIESNEYWCNLLLEKVIEQVPCSSSIVSVIGLTYKPKTDYLEEGFGLRLAGELAQRGYKVIAHDAGFDEERRRKITAFEFSDSLDEALQRSDVCVLIYCDETLLARVAQSAQKKSVIDIWRLIRKTGGAPSSWVEVGRSPVSIDESMMPGIDEQSYLVERSEG